MRLPEGDPTEFFTGYWGFTAIYWARCISGFSIQAPELGTGSASLLLPGESLLISLHSTGFTGVLVNVRILTRDYKLILTCTTVMLLISLLQTMPWVHGRAWTESLLFSKWPDCIKWDKHKKTEGESEEHIWSPKRIPSTLHSIAQRALTDYTLLDFCIGKTALQS